MYVTLMYSYVTRMYPYVNRMHLCSTYVPELFLSFFIAPVE